jgi:hypothetical protein
MIKKPPPSYLFSDYSNYVSEFAEFTHPVNSNKCSGPASNQIYKNPISSAPNNEIMEFPKPLDDNKEYTVNMMPFILDSEYSTLPEECKRYIPLINICGQNCPTEIGKVCYLTIDERYIQSGNSHRRPGLHVETIGKSSVPNGYFFPPWWGGTVGGIFLASNMDDTTLIYSAHVKDDVIGINGDLEHMRDYLEENYIKSILKAGNLFWMTDRTPHESLPLTHPGFRQFFRLVTSQVSFWYSKHSTENPLCKPGPDVIIIDTDKFDID